MRKVSLEKVIILYYTMMPFKNVKKWCLTHFAIKLSIYYRLYCTSKGQDFPTYWIPTHTLRWRLVDSKWGNKKSTNSAPLPVTLLSTICQKLYSNIENLEIYIQIYSRWNQYFLPNTWCVLLLWIQYLFFFINMNLIWGKTDQLYMNENWKTSNFQVTCNILLLILSPVDNEMSILINWT